MSSTTQRVQYNIVCSSIACVPGVPRLHHEVLDDPVDWAVVVVALHGQLHEVPACQRRLLAPQLHVHVAVGRLEQNLAACGGLRAKTAVRVGREHSSWLFQVKLALPYLCVIYLRHVSEYLAAMMSDGSREHHDPRCLALPA